MRILERLMKPSTREMLHEARQIKGYSLFDWIHGYFYMRWPYLYIGLGKGDHPWSKRLAPLLTWIGKIIEKHGGQGNTDSAKAGFENTYHGKVVPLEAARQLVSVKEAVRLENLEQIIPFTRAKDIILKNPDHIVALDCPCRLGKPDPCLPMDVCLIVGEPFAGFVMEHHPKHARWITSIEAQEILKQEDERGHVHHAFFKDAILERFYAICNCCTCCCGAMKAQKNGVPMLISSGFVCKIDETRCSGCGTCESLCQFDAIHVNGTAVVDREGCMGCGVCVNNCPNGALVLERDVNRSAPLEIFSLIAAAEPEG